MMIGREPYLFLAALVIALAATLSLTWIGGELHYRNCLQGVELRYPATYQQATAKTDTQFKIGPQPHFVFYEKNRRDEAISSCSRWP